MFVYHIEDMKFHRGTRPFPKRMKGNTFVGMTMISQRHMSVRLYLSPTKCSKRLDVSSLPSFGGLVVGLGGGARRRGKKASSTS